MPLQHGGWLFCQGPHNRKAQIKTSYQMEFRIFEGIISKACVFDPAVKVVEPWLLCRPDADMEICA